MVAIKRMATVMSQISVTVMSHLLFPVVLLENADRDVAGLAAHLSREHREVAADQADVRIRICIQHHARADLPAHHVLQRDLEPVEHRLDGDVRVPELAREMRFPDRIAAELLAKKSLEKDLAHGL